MSFLPPKYDWRGVQGDTISKPFRWKADGSYVNLSGYTAKCQVRDSSDVLIGEAVCTIDASAGRVNVTFVPLVTAGMAVSNQYRWDLELTSPAGVVQTIVGGKFEIVKGTSA